MNSRPLTVAIVGATGAVGVEFLRCLAERRFPVKELRLLASARSVGRELSFDGKALVVQELTERSFEGVDIALFSAGGGISKRYAPIAVAAGAIVVDNSSAFRMDPEVPLVIPEINAGAIAGHKGIVANPNCAAIIAITPLWPIHQHNRIRRMTIATYQAASGAGAAAMDELADSTRAYLDGRAFQHKVLPHPYAFNLFSHNTAIDPETGYNDEETKVMRETRKIYGDPGPAAVGDLHPRAGPARPCGRRHLRVRTSDRRGPRACAARQRAGRAPRRRPRAQCFPYAARCQPAGRHSGGAHPPGPRRSQRPLDLAVRGGRSVAEGCGSQRGSDRGAPAGGLTLAPGIAVASRSSRAGYLRSRRRPIYFLARSAPVLVAPMVLTNS